MLNSYADDYTANEGTAVATLMQYCGYSVQMDYGPSSGSNTDMVATALRTYFDYNSETVKFVSRSYYTAAKWASLIYHELANGRPVVYGGMSSGGGHEFVCDGYEYDDETETDFFHINWGWSGTSDEYYVLSALAPGQQGIGGSTSTDGFHYGQDAVIGIQPSTSNGSTANITPNVVNLKLNSMTLSNNSVIVGVPVNVTLNITNNSSDDYDGDIYLGMKEGDFYGLLEGSNFLIAANETKDIVIPFLPTETGTYQLVFFLPNTIGSYSTNGEVYATLNVVDLAVTPAPTTATVTWTGDANSYDVRYARLPNTGIGSGWLQYDDGSTSGSLGSDDSNTWTWGVMYPEVTGNRLTKVSFYENKNHTNDITISIYSGDVPSDTPLYTEVVSPIGSPGFHEVTLANPVAITPGENLWIALTTTGTHVIPYCTSTEPNNQWIYYGSLTHIGDVSASFASFGWMIRGYFESTTDFESMSWTKDTSTSGSYTITGLTPETIYVVQVRSDYGSDGKSDWVTTTFKTGVANPVPTDLAAVLKADGATITWTGYGDSYNVQYRNNDVKEVYFVEDFENGLGQWTSVRNGWGNSNTDWQTMNPSTYFTDDPPVAHGGDCVAMSRSWYNDEAFTVDNWLISPKVTLDGILKYWVMDDGSYHEHYDVYVSTTTTDINAFTKVYEPGNASATWTEKMVDLSSYAGQQGYIAFRNADYDKDFLLIDDIIIYKTGTWQEIAVNDATATLSGLATNSGYEYRIQSVKDGSTSEWSESKEFALLTLQDAGTNNSDLIFDNRERQSHVTLANRTLYKDGAWNTICLPFDVTLADSPLAGAIAKTLTAASIENNTITLTFGDPVTTLTAGVPYIIRWTSGEDIEAPAFTDVTLVSSTEEQRTVTFNNDNVQFIGYYDAFGITATNEDIYYLTASNTLRHTGIDRTLNACRAYFQFKGLSANSRFVLDFGDEQTGIELTTDSKLQAIDVWFDLNGRKLNGKPTNKGVYIVNGKKVVIK